jgi:hypothetical protein
VSDSRYDPASPSTALYTAAASARDNQRLSQPRSPSLAHSPSPTPSSCQNVMPVDSSMTDKTNDPEAANETAGHQEPQDREHPNRTPRPVPRGEVLISPPGLTQDYVE